MTIRRLLTATAVFALVQAPAAFAQDEAASPDDAMPEAKITSGIAAEPAPEAPAPADDAVEAPADDAAAQEMVDDAPAQESVDDTPAEAETAPAEASAEAEAGAAEAGAGAETTPREPAAETVPAADVETDADAETAVPAETDPAVEPPAASATPGMNPLIQATANYAQYRRDLNSVRTVNIDSAAALDGVMDRLAAHRPVHLSNAFIGYSALLVAQQQDFVDQVREVAEYFGKDQVITGLLNDPAYVMTFKNSDKALQTALASADDEEADILRLGEKLKQQSYSLQHQDWAMQVADRADRLALIQAPSTPPAPQDYVTALSETGAIASDQEAVENAARREALAGVFDPLRMPETPSAQPVATLTAAGEGDAAVQTASAEPPPADTATDSAPAEAGAEAVTTAVGATDNDTMATIAYDEDEARSTNAIMTLAALEALGVGGTRPEAMTRVMSKVRTQSCLDWAHTQLQVCIAAGHFKYEDAFCIAEHQLNQVAQCLGAVTAN